MSREAPSFGWNPDDQVDYTNIDGVDPSSFGLSYHPDTTYINTADTQYFGNSNQPFTAEENLTSLQTTQIPYDNFGGSNTNDYSESARSSLYSPRPISSSDSRYLGL